MFNLRQYFKKKKKNFIKWYFDTNLILFVSRQIMLISNIYIFLYIIELGLFFSLYFAYIINRFCWDFLTTWYYVDYVFGCIYKVTDDIKFDKKSFFKIINLNMVLLIILRNFIFKIIKSLVLLVIKVKNYIKFYFIRLSKLILFVLFNFVLINLLLKIKIYLYIYILIVFISYTIIFVKTLNYLCNKNLIDYIIIYLRYICNKSSSFIFKKRNYKNLTYITDICKDFLFLIIFKFFFKKINNIIYFFINQRWGFLFYFFNIKSLGVFKSLNIRNCKFVLKKNYFGNYKIKLHKIKLKQKYTRMNLCFNFKRLHYFSILNIFYKLKYINFNKLFKVYLLFNIIRHFNNIFYIITKNKSKIYLSYKTIRLVFLNIKLYRLCTRCIIDFLYFIWTIIYKIISFLLYCLRFSIIVFYFIILKLNFIIIFKLFSFILMRLYNISYFYFLLYKNYLYLIYFDYKKKYLTEDNVNELKLYKYNKTLLFKKINYKLKLILIYFLDNLEYHLLVNTKIWKKKNIVKFHKKKILFKKFKSNLELFFYNYRLELILLYIFKAKEFKLLNYNIYILILNSLPILPTLRYYKNLLDCKILQGLLYIKSSYDCIKDLFLGYLMAIYIWFSDWCFKNSNSINILIYRLYIPIWFLNFILSDIALSITYLLIITKKKYIINVIIISVLRVLSRLWYLFNLYFKKIYIYIKKYSKLIYRYIKFGIFYIVRKIIYIILITCYFYNYDLAWFLILDVYNEFIFDYISSYNWSNYINFLFNVSNFYFLTTLVGIQIVIFWSKWVSKFFGRILWSLTVFPVFLEFHKLLYFKLFCTNFLYYNTYDYILLLKYNILELFNYKIYNIYSFFTSLFLVWLLILFIRRGAFKHVYSDFRYSKWIFIKYPFYICMIEIFRLKIIEYISVFILYINYKIGFYTLFLKFVIGLSNNIFFLMVVDFIQDFIFEFEFVNYSDLYMFFIPNLYIINFVLDFWIFWIAFNWVLIYLNKYKEIDSDFFAAPVVVMEIFYKYYFIYLFLYHFLQQIYIWTIDGTILWYSFQVLVYTYLYLEFRVHKIPRKTMPWYFRQIIELWPSLYFNPWCTVEYLYKDQQKYIVMRFRLKTFKLEKYKPIYKELEIWNKIIILNYQKEKNKAVRLVAAYLRLMSRKENMLREINNFEYQGWYEDWEYNYKNINIYSWKLDLWDKPYFYQFKKTIYFSNVKFFSFDYRVPIERFCSKYMHLTYLFFITNLYDWFYVQKYIHILDKDEISSLSLDEWKSKFFNEKKVLDELVHLKKLKIVLMSFSSGEAIKTPDWVFPYEFEKRYKTEGWSMFEDPRIDAIQLDWRPILNDLN